MKAQTGKARLSALRSMQILLGLPNLRDQSTMPRVNKNFGWSHAPKGNESYTPSDETTHCSENTWEKLQRQLKQPVIPEILGHNIFYRAGPVLVELFDKQIQHAEILHLFGKALERVDSLNDFFYKRNHVFALDDVEAEIVFWCPFLK